VASDLIGHIFGVDEAGRGALAGPLVVAAVESPWTIPIVVRDSKALSPDKRKALYRIIRQNCRHAWSIVEPAWIDKFGIQAAETRGLIEVVEQLITPAAAIETNSRIWPEMIVCDGTPDTWGADHWSSLYLHGKELSQRLRFMIKGDVHVPAISAASIVAKVIRDEYMQYMALFFKAYGFDLHKGYGTPLHLAALEEFGSCELHRHSFRPVKDRDARDL